MAVPAHTETHNKKRGQGSGFPDVAPFWLASDIKGHFSYCQGSVLFAVQQQFDIRAFPSACCTFYPLSQCLFLFCN